VVEQRPEVAQHLRPAIRTDKDTVYEVGPGQMKHVLGHGIALMSQQAFGFVTEYSLNVFDHDSSCGARARGRFRAMNSPISGLIILCALDTEVNATNYSLGAFAPVVIGLVV